MICFFHFLLHFWLCCHRTVITRTTEIFNENLCSQTTHSTAQVWTWLSQRLTSLWLHSETVCKSFTDEILTVLLLSSPVWLFIVMTLRLHTDCCTCDTLSKTCTCIFTERSCIRSRIFTSVEISHSATITMTVISSFSTCWWWMTTSLTWLKMSFKSEWMRLWFLQSVWAAWMIFCSIIHKVMQMPSSRHLWRRNCTYLTQLKT